MLSLIDAAFTISAAEAVTHPGRSDRTRDASAHPCS
jgi:hypothetical protein